MGSGLVLCLLRYLACSHPGFCRAYARRGPRCPPGPPRRRARPLFSAGDAGRIRLPFRAGRPAGRRTPPASAARGPLPSSPLPLRRHPAPISRGYGRNGILGRAGGYGSCPAALAELWQTPPAPAENKWRRCVRIELTRRPLRRRTGFEDRAAHQDECTSTPYYNLSRRRRHRHLHADEDGADGVRSCSLPAPLSCLFAPGVLPRICKTWPPVPPRPSAPPRPPSIQRG